MHDNPYKAEEGERVAQPEWEKSFGKAWLIMAIAIVTVVIVPIAAYMILAYLSQLGTYSGPIIR